VDRETGEFCRVFSVRPRKAREKSCDFNGRHSGAGDHVNLLRKMGARSSARRVSRPAPGRDGLERRSRPGKFGRRPTGEIQAITKIFSKNNEMIKWREGCCVSAE
jgi:hypothetical protein